MQWTALKDQHAIQCPFIKKYKKNVISDKQFLEIKEVVFSKDLEVSFGTLYFKGSKKWNLGASQT